MKTYRFDKGRGLVDQNGDQVLQLVANCCSQKFRIMAGRELAEKLNTIERGKACHKGE